MSEISRRQFLRASALAAAGVAVVACAKKEEPTQPVVEEPTKPAAVAATATPKPVEMPSEQEAPELVAMVKAGSIPSLNERLPKNPKVLSKSANEIPTDHLDLTIGRYGGTIRTVQPGPTWQPDIFVGCCEPLCAAPGILADGIVGGVAEGFEVQDGGKTFVFHLREGLKWSDGEPATTEDVQFMYEDVLSNEQLSPTFPAFMKTGNSAAGDPLAVEIVDSYTFNVKFTEAYAGFAAFLAILQWKGYTELMLPKHHCIQFHADYTPLADLEPMIQEESLGEGEWWTLFWAKTARNWDLCNPKAVGFPNCQPWFVVAVEDTVSKYDRNPYYFKVDADGKQLPYIDKIQSAVVADVEMSQLKVLAGEVDFLREDATIDNLALYKENAAKGGYRIQLLDMHVSPTDVFVNQTYDDPVWRLVARDKRFRKALSLATDRPTIIDAIYFGFAEMPVSVPSDYDPDAANALLEEMGMTERDADGFRLAPGGEPFEILFEVSQDASDVVPVTEMLVENYKEVGIKTSMKVIEGALRDQRGAANELQARACWHHWPELWWGALWDIYPGGWGGWGQLWQDWFDTNGEEGEEPPAEVIEFIDLVNKSIVVDGEEREQTIAAWKEIMYDQLYIIPTVERVKYPLVVNSKLQNVPTAGFAIAANFSLEQMYYEE